MIKKKEAKKRLFTFIFACFSFKTIFMRLLFRFVDLWILLVSDLEFDWLLYSAILKLNWIHILCILMECKEVCRIWSFSAYNSKLLSVFSYNCAFLKFYLFLNEAFQLMNRSSAINFSKFKNLCFLNLV